MLKEIKEKKPKNLKEKLIRLQKMGYESVLISDVLGWIRYFSPIRKRSPQKLVKFLCGERLSAENKILKEI